MKRLLRLAACAPAIFVGTVLTARSAVGGPLLFGVSPREGAPSSASAVALSFDISGSNVNVTLGGAPPSAAQSGSGALTASFNLTSSLDDQEASDGQHDVASCKEIAGWAWNPRRPDTPIEVTIEADQTPLVTLKADRFRQDLQAAQKGNGYHGFVYPLPAQLKDGTPHQIRVTASGFDLTSSPKMVTCAPEPASK